MLHFPAPLLSYRGGGGARGLGEGVGGVGGLGGGIGGAGGLGGVVGGQEMSRRGGEGR